MIFDANGNELTYWPISGLVESQSSEAIYMFVVVPEGPGYIGANRDDRMGCWVQYVGIDSIDDVPENLRSYPMPSAVIKSLFNYPVDVSTSPYWLGEWNPGELVRFTVSVEALIPISGLERVPIGVNTLTSGQAGWVYPEEISVVRPKMVRRRQPPFLGPPIHVEP